LSWVDELKRDRASLASEEGKAPHSTATLV
jgi:hypothetical protein